MEPNQQPNQPQPTPQPAPVKHSISRAIVYGILGLGAGLIVGAVLAGVVPGSVGDLLLWVCLLGFTFLGILAARAKDRSDSGRDAQLEAQATANPPVSKVPFYRQYPAFIIITLLTPGIVCLVIIFSGNVYKKLNQNFVPISKKEKYTVAAVVILLQLWAIFRYL